jgi:molecular chaperone GrpE
MQNAKPVDDDGSEGQVHEELIVEPQDLSIREKLEESEARRLEAERQVADLSDRFRKAQAQMNTETNELRLRLQRNFDQKLEIAKSDLIATLLETLDNLKRAVSVAESPEGLNDHAALLDGVRATADIFDSQLKGLGLAPVESVGAPFNPELHEAVEMVPASDEDHERVVEELQTGYKVGDRLIRPARVRVGRRIENQE